MPWVRQAVYNDLLVQKAHAEWLQKKLDQANVTNEITQAVNRRQEEEIAELKVVLYRERSRLDAILLDAPSLENSVMKKLLAEGRKERS